ncbi:hypothetical protein AAFC00_005122 [Neodothiora populina]
MATSSCQQETALRFSEKWQVLGPFQIGTREATWGADPLEFYGGFPKLQYSLEDTYPSPLAPNASVGWSETTIASSCTSDTTQVALSFDFSDIDWSFQQRIYGWAALQYQAWARGVLTVSGDAPRTLVFYSPGLLEFYVDGVHHFGGDYYAYGKVPLVLHLEPGDHIIDLRLIRDVRSMGGIGDPTIDVSMSAELSDGKLVICPDSVLLPDMVNGRLAGNLGSVTVRNDGLEDAFVDGVSVNDTSYFAWLARPSSTRIAPGQTRPIAFVITCQSAGCSPSIRIDIEYTQARSSSMILSVSTNIAQTDIFQPHKITFLNPGGMVSYAILRPPSLQGKCATAPDGTLPILLGLHGAGVDAASPMIRHSFDPVPDLCAWALYPTGSTLWSGDDWHTWGFADVEAAIEALPVWTTLVDWKGPGVAVDRWLVVGHSNGGQGTWYTLTHRPDKVVAAAPISGYSSIQNYVSYNLWTPMDPLVRMLLETSLSDYKHELLLQNAEQIPIMQQHGSVDDNVPAFHSRLMNCLLRQVKADSSYVELEDKNHWFDGIMTTEPLRAFYEQELGSASSTVIPPSSFSFVVANPANMGSRHGLRVLQLCQHGRLGRVAASFDTDIPTCYIQTSNVLSLHIPAIYTRTHDIVLDGQKIDVENLQGVTLWQTPEEGWKAITRTTGPATRNGRQLGSMDALLRTKSGLEIVRTSRSAAIDKVALQISRNLHQYFGSDTDLVDKSGSHQSDYGNAVRVALGKDVPATFVKDFPINVIHPGIVSLRDASGNNKLYSSEKGLAAIYLRPLKDEQVELMVWGADDEGLEIAARLVPMLTGVGQPDFVIADSKMLWGGAGAVLAMGYFDHLWNVTADSFLT